MYHDLEKIIFSSRTIGQKKENGAVRAVFVNFRPLEKMKKIFFCFILMFPTLFFQGQNVHKGTITVSKNCCTQLHIWLQDYLRMDTIYYDELVNENGFAVLSDSCNKNTSVPIISFEMSINKGKRQNCKGAQYNFKSVPDLIYGGEITITNCIVECKIAGKESKFKVLPDQVITIMGSKTSRKWYR